MKPRACISMSGTCVRMVKMVTGEIITPDALLVVLADAGFATMVIPCCLEIGTVVVAVDNFRPG